MSQNYVYSDNKIGHQQYDSASNKNQRPHFIIPTKDTPVSHYAKMSGMSNEEFMKWTGVKSTFIKKGTKIALPMDKVPEGKGIFALARKYNMSVEEFCKLNRIPKPYNKYKAKKNEEFYVKPYKLPDAQKAAVNKKDNSTPSELSLDELSEIIDSRDDLEGAAGGVVLGAYGINQSIWDSSFTPKEIALRIEEICCDKIGAVGKKQFDDMLKEINPKNVSDVLTEYAKANDGRSLIDRITSEFASRQSARKEAVMYIYDALAKQKNIPANERKIFEQELNEQFDSFGFVNTEKMDSIIDKMLKVKVTEGQIITHNYTVKYAAADTKVQVKDGDNPAKLFTAGQLKKDAVNSAKNEASELFKQYCKNNNVSYSEDKLDLTPMNRIPAPVVKNGKIAASETELLKPTSTPNGKVVILNPGHGGYSSRTGYFDSGSYSFIKKANGKYAPLLEYEKMNIYAEDTVDKLRSKGYAVVLMGGHVETISDQKSVSGLITRLQNGSKGGQKYNKDDIIFVSLHADSQPGMSGTGVCYDPRFKDDSKLADTLKSNLNKDDWIKAGTSTRVPGTNGLQVLMQSENIPSVLIEVEYVNGSKCQNLDSKAFQDRFENKLVDGLDQYFGLR